MSADTTPATRPVPLSRVWTREAVVAEDLTGDDLSNVLELHSDASAWWVLPRGEPYAEAELRPIARVLDLDHLAVEDLLADNRRPKAETVGQARIVLASAVVVDRQAVALAVRPVSLLVTDRALICLTAAAPGFAPARLLASRAAVLTVGGAESALREVLAAVVASYEDAVEWIEDACDELAGPLFQERPLARVEQLRVFRLRTALSALRRVTEPMRDVLTDLADEPPPPPPGTPVPKGKGARHPAARHWSRLAERQRRVADAADALGGSLTSVFDTSLALSDAHSNQVVRRLTGWAAILAVPTLVTGFVGMNVEFPLSGTAVGFWFYCAVMVVLVAVLYVFFRRRGWV